MEKIRVRHQGEKNIYVHNDLSNAAHHFKTTIEEKIKANNRSGIAFDYMACLIMLAFTFESKINFLGHKLIESWKERQPFNDKLSEVLKHLNLEPDWTVRPYLSIERLKAFRDSIAHGKPVEIEFDETKELPADEVDRQIDLDSAWVDYCSHDSVFATYDDVDAIWKDLLDRSGLTVFDTITHGSSGLSYVEKVIET